MWSLLIMRVASNMLESHIPSCRVGLSNAWPENAFPRCLEWSAFEIKVATKYYIEIRIYLFQLQIGGEVHVIHNMYYISGPSSMTYI